MYTCIHQSLASSHHVPHQWLVVRGLGSAFGGEHRIFAEQHGNTTLDSWDIIYIYNIYIYIK